MASEKSLAIFLHIHNNGHLGTGINYLVGLDVEYIVAGVRRTVAVNMAEL